MDLYRLSYFISNVLLFYKTYFKFNFKSFKNNTFNLLINIFFSECPLGYYGSYCNTSCPTGTFGDQCAGICFPNCSSETCHKVYGCLERNDGQTHANPSGKIVLRIFLFKFKRFFFIRGN